MLPLYAWLGGGTGARPEDYPGVIRFGGQFEIVRAAAERLGLPVVQSADGMDVTLSSPAEALALGEAIGSEHAGRTTATAK
jgi:hypothetical protein